MPSPCGVIVSVVSGLGDTVLNAAHLVEEQRTGAGVQEWRDGSRYEGEFLNGFKHGRGKYTWGNGEYYEGSFYKDFRHGDGVYCWPSRHKFIGKFYLNRKEGYGQHWFPDGSHFQGLYHADQRFGPGVMTYPDGRQDVGLWHNERLIRLCTTFDEGFTLKDFPEYAAYMDTDTTTTGDHEPYSHPRQKHSKQVNHCRDHFSDDTVILPSGIERYSIDGDHLPLPPDRRKELDGLFFGDLSEPDLYQGYERDPLSTLPLEARMQAHIHKHRLQAKTMNWDVDAVLSLNRKGFGTKGPLEVSSELLIQQVSQGKVKSVSQILRSGLVHPDVADALRYTALMAATVNCCDSVIEVLLDMGADIDKLNCENMSALAVCHVLYYPFTSLHITEELTKLHRKDRNLKSEAGFVSVSVDDTQSNDRPRTTDTVQTHSHVFSEESAEELVLQQLSEVSNKSELADEECTAPNEPQTHVEHDHVTEDSTEERHTKKEQENEIRETAEKNKTEEVEVKKDIEQQDQREDNGMSQEVVGVERYIEVMDGDIAVGSVQWKEYPAKGKIKEANVNEFDSTCFQIHVTEEAMQRSAEALSRSGIGSCLETEETVRKMAAMKIEHRECLNTLRLLLERGADPNVCRVPMPVLFLSVMASDVDAVRRLLLCGARTDIPLPPEFQGLYPLHVAAGLPGSAGPKITELLLHAITDPDARACDKDKVYKFDKGTDHVLRSTVDTRDREGGRTALHVACGRDSDYLNASKIVALLLSHGARTDLLWSGHSPLSLAIASGNEMAVEELLKGGADPNVPLGNRVGSALCALANNRYHLCGNRIKLLEMLVKAGADILMPVMMENVQGTSVDYAYYSFHQDTRIATTPYHALNMQEREILKERHQLLRSMGDLLRQSALQREKERQLRSETTDGSSQSSFKFCFYCGRSASVKLSSCSRCHMVFYCSKSCKLKAWNQGHKDECIRPSAKSPQPQTPKSSSQRKAREGGDATAQKNVISKSQKGAKGGAKTKTAPKALNVTCNPKISKFMNFDTKPRSVKETEVAECDLNVNENYSFI